MMEHFIISVLSGLGLAILLVEYRFKYPVKTISIHIKMFLHYYISKKFARVMKCTVCLSFWTTLICDLLYSFVTNTETRIIFSSFVACGIGWFLYQLLSVIEKSKA